jgi:hypothetical protein
MSKSKPPKYSKRVREEAALICAIAALRENDDRDCCYHVVAEDTGASDDALDLARAAFRESNDALPDLYILNRLHDAEAESLIRTGWTP